MAATIAILIGFLILMILGAISVIVLAGIGYFTKDSPDVIPTALPTDTVPPKQTQ